LRIAVIGANGRTGQHVVKQALARGNEVVAVARRPEEVGLQDGSLELRRADVLDPSALDLAGCDAVISALGVGTSRAPTRVFSDGITNVLSAMRKVGANTLAVISAAPAGPRDEQPFMQRRIAMPILEAWIGAQYDDMRRMEEVLRNSDVEWIAVRPPRLVGGAAKGNYRIGTAPLKRGRQLTYGDLATALLDSLALPEFRRGAAYVAN
jgi:putative NADH-flavin reductase